MTLFRDLGSHHIQQHSTKSTNCTYLSSYFWWLIFLIYQTSFIYYWKLFFLHHINHKRTSRYSICWKVHHLLFYFFRTHFSFFFFALAFDYWVVDSKIAIGSSKTFFRSYFQFETRKTWSLIARLARCNKNR